MPVWGIHVLTVTVRQHSKHVCIKPHFSNCVQLEKKIKCSVCEKTCIKFMKCIALLLGVL